MIIVVVVVLRGAAWEHYDKKGYHRCHPPHGYKLRKSELFFFIAKKYNYKKNMGFYKNLFVKSNKTN